ncbi:hypothetical protein ADEAN_000304000 [Angomonas deanei]|uniref:Uncharacterized protein n=1 Tax=Angomonas deanei TaxID=59799 RepID=A0A7G2C817_9TRYP|nr:hypothetical protein ADEAN_000304000 [Angomonas deanei]
MALVPLEEDLTNQIHQVQQRRKLLHDATVVEETGKGKSKSPSPSAAPVKQEPPRTVDGPTLNDLKSPNYPFLLCEEAPPSYIPPPVPFDVEGEVDILKQKVLQVQQEFTKYEKKLKKEGRVARSEKTGEVNETGAKKTALSEEQIVEFFSLSTNFAELAWAVSTLIWFYRWVLSHSISHLWNCKESLEYALQDNNQPLPTTSEEMDAALEQFPFTQAVSILDNDRSATIAQERRRIRSVSRTFKDGLPAIAVNAATSSYLSTEEKYMYQEFFNQSEHLMLLLNHAKLLEKSQAALKSRGGSAGGSNSRDPSLDAQTGALMTEEDMMNVRMLTEDAMSAMGAEEQVIESLIDTIADRKKNGVAFDVSPEERERSRTAMVAVYGCVVSDMRLMGEQMSVAAEFLNKYEGWLRFYGLGGHDPLMERLSKITGGNYWPVLPSYGGHPNGHSHSHGGDYGDDFVNPTDAFIKPRESTNPRSGVDSHTQSVRNSTENTTRQKPNPRPRVTSPESPPVRSSQESVPKQQQQPQPKPKASQAAPAAKNNEKSAESSQRPREAAAAPAAAPKPKTAPAPKAAPASEAPKHQDPSASRRSTNATSQNDLYPIRTFDTPKSAPTFDDNAIANVFFQILQLVDNYRKVKGQTADDAKLARAWQIVCLRYTVLRVVNGEWNASNLVQRIDGIGASLQEKLAQSTVFSELKINASGLLAVVFLLASLMKATPKSTQPLLPVSVVVHILFPANDYKQEVEYTLTAAETDRWGALLDALWVQADPSGSAHGGFLAQPERAEVKFLRLLAIEVQGRSAGKATITLQYATADLLDRKTRLFRTVVDCERGLHRRYQLTRSLLVALYELETRGHLPSYACRTEEVKALPFGKVLFLTDDRSYLCGILSPGAIQLKRIHQHLGDKLARPGTEALKSEPFVRYTKKPNFSTIGLLLSEAMHYIAMVTEPHLSDVFLTAESLKEQSEWELDNKVLPRSFSSSSRHPVAVALNREKALANRNCISIHRFINPLIRQLDDSIQQLPAETKSSRSNSMLAGSSKRNSVV